MSTGSQRHSNPLGQLFQVGRASPTHAEGDCDRLHEEASDEDVLTAEPAARDERGDGQRQGRNEIGTEKIGITQTRADPPEWQCPGKVRPAKQIVIEELYHATRLLNTGAVRRLAAPEFVGKWAGYAFGLDADGE